MKTSSNIDWHLSEGPNRIVDKTTESNLKSTTVRSLIADNLLLIAWVINITSPQPVYGVRSPCFFESPICIHITHDVIWAAFIAGELHTDRSKSQQSVWWQSTNTHSWRHSSQRTVTMIEKKKDEWETWDSSNYCLQQRMPPHEIGCGLFSKSLTSKF